MSKRRAKRKLERWWRYIEHYMGERFLVPPGMLRAHNARNRAERRTARAQEADRG